MGRTLTSTAAVHVCDAGHGFDRDRRGSHGAASAKLAMRHTIDSFDMHPG